VLNSEFELDICHKSILEHATITRLGKIYVKVWIVCGICKRKQINEREEISNILALLCHGEVKPVDTCYSILSLGVTGTEKTAFVTSESSQRQTQLDIRTTKELSYSPHDLFVNDIHRTCNSLAN
jgi:hypothetical protein